jgi:ribonuclease D
MTSSEPLPTLITDAAGLTRLDAALTHVTRLAIDTESNSMHAYTERLCLVQVAFGDPADPTVVAIDPLAPAFAGVVARALAPLITWWSQPDHAVVAHGASYDIAIFRRDLGAVPHSLVDTQIAATLLGIEKTGYGSLVADFRGVTLSKSFQQHDWARRPIDAAALAYALADARHLLPLADVLVARIRAAELDDEFAIACTAIRDTPAHAPRPAAETFWRLATSEGKPPPRPALLLLKQLIDWRDRVSAALDMPPGRVINNAQLLSFARNPPADRETWRRKLPKRVSEGDIDTLVAALATAPSDGPLPPRERMPDAPPPIVRAREKHLKRWRDDEARARGVGAQAILASPTIAHLAQHGPDGLATAPQLGESRMRRYAATLRAMLANPNL